MKKPSFTKSLIALLLFLFPSYLFSQTFFAASAAIPTDGNAHPGPSATLTPPLSMVTNDLTIVYAQYASTAATPSISGGGQTWNTATTYAPVGFSQSTAIFWCTFNGTWTGGGPTITVGAGNTLALTAVMYVFHPSVSSHVWGVNAVGTDATSSGGANTITGVTTTMANTVNMGFWGVAANNTWGSLSGTWTKPGSVQYRNTTTAQSSTAAFRILSSAGGTGSPVQTQTGTTSATVLKSMVSWNELANDDCSGAISLTPGVTCTNTAANVGGAKLSSSIPTPGCGTPTYDVWYKFTALSYNPTITISGNTNFADPHIQLLSGTCAGTLTEQACSSTGTLTASGLTLGTSYLVRVFSAASLPTTGGNFNICITDPPPANDNCTNAALLTSGANGTLYAASGDGGTIASTCTAVSSPDVWFKFVAQISNPTITASNLGSNWGTNLKLQLLTGTCGSFTEVACANNAPLTPTLTVGTIYYIRVQKATGGTPTGGYSAWNFDIFIDPAPLSTMGEVFTRTTILPAGIFTGVPWEVTYGPDNFLWVTDAKGYKAYRINPSDGTRTTILDLSNGASDFPSLDVGFTTAQSPWPQGGFAGLAIHPQFNSGKPFVYISYVKSYTAGGSSGPGYFFTNSIVRFTYNSGTGKLESPQIICDTLPGSSDHNSQRMIIAPVGGTNYLFYAQGDMGAGQLVNSGRTNKAQNLLSYEGKILRFNLESDGDAGAYDKWIPLDNPHNGASQSAVWAIGIRNNQGFAYDTTLGILYGASHGPYSDDEINVIERDKNYGHPYVIGYASDNNYNLSNAGTPNNSPSSTLAVISNETTAAAGILNYKDPLFSGYAPDQTTLHNIWVNNPSNSGWPSEAWSGIDIYKNTIIPGWKNSLVVCGLKWGRVLRLKLGPTGQTIAPTNGADTLAYFQSHNRFRDLAFDPNGKDIYVSMEGSTSVGPNGSTTVAPTVPQCTNCIIKYTFLGYADAGGKSAIPDAISVTDTSTSSYAFMNSVDSATTVTIDDTNNKLWVPITGPDGNILAEIYANGHNLGAVHSAFYKNVGAIRSKKGVKYLDRNITIKPDVQPSGTVKIRLYITKAEFDSLDNDPTSGINGLADLKILKNEDDCGSAILSSTLQVDPTSIDLHDGTNGYVVQGDISSFSSFYFASANIILPLNLLTFKGSLQNNNTLLEWETTNEVNTFGFIIERSIDGHNFQQIGTTEPKGSTSKNKYSFIDYDARRQSSLVLYYRLKMVDKDGGYVYSNVVTITLPATASKIAVFPNPAFSEVRISIAVPADGKVQWSLVDNAGRIVIQNSAQLKKGNNNVSMNIAGLSPGVYFLNVSGPGIDQKVKLEKL